MHDDGEPGALASEIHNDGLRYPRPHEKMHFSNLHHLGLRLDLSQLGRNSVSFHQHVLHCSNVLLDVRGELRFSVAPPQQRR